jgi:hypothetical protein
MLRNVLRRGFGLKFLQDRAPTTVGLDTLKVKLVLIALTSGF